MNHQQLMKYQRLENFSDKEAIVKAWSDGDDLAVLTEEGRFYLLLNGTWLKYEPCNLKDFVMCGDRALALTKDGYLLSHSSIKEKNNSQSQSDGNPTAGIQRAQSNFQFVHQLKGIIFVMIAIEENDRCLALAQDDVLYEWRLCCGGNGFNRYELDWTLYDDIEPRVKTVTHILSTTKYPIVLTKFGKVFIPLDSEDIKEFEDINYDKLHVFGETLSDKKVIELAVGKDLTFALTDCGKIYKWSVWDAFNQTPELIDYKCRGLHSKGKKIWAADTVELLLILSESGEYISIRFSDASEVIFKSTIQSRSAFDYFNSCGVPFNGCFYNGINKMANIEVQDLWMSKVESIFVEKECSDLIIEVKGKPIHCHKSFVSAHCEYLRNAIKMENMKKNVNENLRLCLKDLEYETVHSILNYFYTGRLEFHSFDITLELIEVTEMWLEKDLQKCFVDQAIQCLSLENVHLAEKMADKLNIQVLKRECLLLKQDLLL